MKKFRLGLAAWLPLVLTATALTPLPEATLGPFAPVPAAITRGPLLPALPMERQPPTFGDCRNARAILKDLAIDLTKDQIRLFDTQHFLLLPIESTALAESLSPRGFTSDEMLAAFERFRGGEDSEKAATNARLVTPDLALHAWHCGFSRAWEDSETNALVGRLEVFLTNVLRNTRDLRATATGPVAERLAWAEARFAAPWILLGPPDPMRATPISFRPPQSLPPYSDGVNERLTQACEHLSEAVAAALKQEISLVLAARGIDRSPLFSPPGVAVPVDYSQFKPRSHYTKSDCLGGYFRAMMFLGSTGYDLSRPDSIGDAALAVLVMVRAPEKDKLAPIAAWKEIMEITGFFAGQSDDITYPEFRAWLQASLGSTELDADSAISAEFTGKLAANLANLRRVGIAGLAGGEAPAPSSFRIFGQRFTRDAMVLERFTRRSSDEFPALPTAAMIPAAFGDPFAEHISRDHISSKPAQVAAFDQCLPQVRKELAAVSDAAWFSSMASKQLHVMSTLTRPRNGNFPAFMKHDAFRAKNLTSMLGSYTELKHDTVLYAKQAVFFGEGGSTDEQPPPPSMGFVQPDVAFWSELERLARFAKDGFARHRLLPDAGEEFSRFGRFARDMQHLRIIAEKEVAGTMLTRKDDDTIRSIDLSYMLKPQSGFEAPKPGDGKCAIVTDVLTDAGAGTILSEALGRPLVMLALVGGKDGQRMVVGLAYNHFEFARPMANGRLTDEEWQANIYIAQPMLPERSAWAAPVTVPASRPKAAD